MGKLNVIIELSHSDGLINSAEAGMVDYESTDLDAGVVPDLGPLAYDDTFPAVMLPRLTERETPEGELYDMTAELECDMDAKASTYLVRGSVEEDKLEAFEKQCDENPAVVQAYADVGIQPMIVCPGSPPVGSDSTVESLLCASKMHSNGMHGKGVLVAIVDTGVNMAYLSSQGKTPNFDLARSWSWTPSVTPGSAAVGHGTMCAFDVCIAAPRCTLLDIALLHPVSAAPGGTIMESLLSDAIRAYRHLLNVMNAPRRPGEHRSMVVNNSWGMFHPSWDRPVVHPGNYSDNPKHPFNRIVASLERAGADILFAAGNCGKDCPDGRCRGVTTRAIYGANSSPSVTCVAGVDTTKARVGYSAIGPGRLERRKPDICGYTHFSGSGVYTADGGTSAACPVVSGVVAAVRTKRPYDPGNSQTRPAAIRNLLTSTAQDLGATGYDYQYGYGVVDGCKLVNKLTKPVIIDICRRYPWICDRRWWRRIFRIRWRLQAEQGASTALSPDMEADIDAMMQPEELQSLLGEVMPEALEGDQSPEQIAYQIGYMLGKQDAEAEKSTENGSCECED